MTSAVRHLLSIRDLSRSDIDAILDLAAGHKRARRRGETRQPLARRLVATLFFEDSTRTRSSFEIAARALGADVLSWSAKGSSLAKGESLVDTVKNLDAMQPATMVIRHPSSGAAYRAAQNVQASVVNAGDGTHEHPSQALLDAFTIREKLGPLEGKSIVIVGDILHSRVARSCLHCFTRLGAQVTLCGPKTLLPPAFSDLGANLSHDLDEALPQADAVMMLRIQMERQSEALLPSAKEFAACFGLNTTRAHRLKESAIVLHPGPMNRGVEIANEVADGPRSVILEQVENGVAVRMAILERSC